MFIFSAAGLRSSGIFVFICLFFSSGFARLCVESISDGEQKRESSQFWEKEEEEFRENIPLISRRIQVMKEMGSALIPYLEKLRFVLEPKIVIPNDIRKIQELINEEASEIFSRGLRTFRIADFVYQPSTNGKAIHQVQFGDELPLRLPGLQISRTANAAEIASSFSKLLTQGIFPSGPYGPRILGQGTTAFLHNLGHFFAAQSNPEIYDLILRKIGSLRNQRQDGEISEATFRAYAERFQFLFENLSVASPANFIHLRLLLDLPNDEPTFEEIRLHLEKKTSSELVNLGKKLDTQIPPLILRIGGGLYDPYITEKASLASEDQMTEMENKKMPAYFGDTAVPQAYYLVSKSTFDDVWALLKNSLRPYENLVSEEESKKYRTDLIQSIARFQKRMLDLLHLTAQDWVNGLLDGPIVPLDSPLRLFFGMNSPFTSQSKIFFENGLFSSPYLITSTLRNSRISSFECISKESWSDMNQFRADIISRSDVNRHLREDKFARHQLDKKSLKYQVMKSYQAIESGHFEEIARMLRSADGELRLAAIFFLAMRGVHQLRPAGQASARPIVIPRSQLEEILAAFTLRSNFTPRIRILIREIIQTQLQRQPDQNSQLATWMKEILGHL